MGFMEKSFTGLFARRPTYFTEKFYVKKELIGLSILEASMQRQCLNRHWTVN